MVTIVGFFQQKHSSYEGNKFIHFIGNHVVEQKLDERYLIAYLIFILIRKRQFNIPKSFSNFFYLILNVQ